MYNFYCNCAMAIGFGVYTKIYYKFIFLTFFELCKTYVFIEGSI